MSPPLTLMWIPFQKRVVKREVLFLLVGLKANHIIYDFLFKFSIFSISKIIVSNILNRAINDLLKKLTRMHNACIVSKLHQVDRICKSASPGASSLDCP